MTRLTIFALLISVTVGSIAIIDAQSVSFTPAEELPPSSAKIYATGFVEGVCEDIQLRPEVAGLVAEVIVEEGDWVEAGSLILRLDQRREIHLVASSQANLQLAEAQLERLVNGAREEERLEARALLAAKQARLDQALLTWQRIRQLRDQRAITEQEADDQRGKVDALTAEVAAAKARLEQLEAPARADEMRVAEARVAAAQANLELSLVALEKTQLRAPRRGQMLDLNVEPGEFVGPEIEEPLAVLSDTSSLRIRAFVEEVDAPRVQMGMPVHISADGLFDRTFSGKVQFLSPRMAAKQLTSGRADELYDVKVREVLIEVEGDTTGLLIGLRVDVMMGIVNTEAEWTTPPPTVSKL